MEISFKNVKKKKKAFSRTFTERIKMIEGQEAWQKIIVFRILKKNVF